MESVLLFFSTPVFAAFILGESLLSHYSGRDLYGLKDTFTSFFLGAGGILFDVLMKGFGFWMLNTIYQNYSLFQVTHPVWSWVGVFFAQDFFFYWLHRAEHTSRFFWATHVTHHSSTKFNFTVALRSSVLQPLYRYFFFIPCALLGFDAIHVMFIYAVNQTYAFFLHTETIRTLGFLEHFLVTPSHHRVHHASDTRYLDKNMGQVLIIWDKLFGTFEKETSPVTYGLTTNLTSDNLVNVVFHEWKEIAKDLKQPLPLSVRLKYIFKAPGWSHDGTRKTSHQLQKDLNESS